MKSFQEAYTEMVRVLYARTGLEPDLVEGSDIRSILEALAFQINDLSIRWDVSLEEAIPRAVFEAFGFVADPGRVSIGTLRFTSGIPAPLPVLIPKGTQAISPEGIIVETTVEVFIPAGQTTVDVAAVCITKGTVGNLPPNSFTRLLASLPGVASVTNITAFTLGKDPETLDEQTARFRKHLDELRQGSEAGIAASLLAVELPDGDRLSDVLILDHEDDPAIPYGAMHVHYYRLGGLSDALKEALRVCLRARRGAGVIPFPFYTTPTLVPVHLDIDTTVAGVKAIVEQAVATYFSLLKYGQKFSYENLITAATNAHPAIREVTLIAPNSDISIQRTGHLALGSLLVTEELVV